MMKSRALNVKARTPEGDAFLGWLLSFKFEDSIVCSKEKPVNFRLKKVYIAEEQRLLDLLRNVDGSVSMMCPIVCSGFRGDGSKYRRKCNFFKGYGVYREKVWNFACPPGFVWCAKAEEGKVYVQKVTSECKKKKLAVTVARDRKLISHFGSAALEKATIEECKACSHFAGNKCDYKIKCKIVKDWYFVMSCGCKWGDCDTCSSPIKPREGE